MDKRNLKTTDTTKPEKKDRGDNLKKVEKVFKKLLDKAEEVKSLNPGGDTERRVFKEDKPRVIVYKKSDDGKLKILEHALSKEILVKKNEKGEETVKNLAKRNETSTETIKYLVKRNEKSDEIVKNLMKKNEKSDDAKNLVKRNEKSDEQVKNLARRNDKSPAPDKVKIKEKSDETIKNFARKNEKADETARSTQDERKRARDKNSLKPKNSAAAPIAKKDELTKLNVKLPIVPIEDKNDRLPKKPELLPEFSPSIEYSPLEHPRADRKKESQRKPVIKTVTANTKVFKAVTFVDQKSTPTSLQIKIPTEVKSTNRSVETNTRKLNPTVSRVSLKEKHVSSRRVSHGKKLEKRKHTTSPVVSAKVRSPPTEVAKWAPSSINRHTKPYYEAWVNTTLAAISKNAKMDKLFLEKQNLLQSFQRALSERPETPELVYENFNDERYTGRIKVNSKHRPQVQT